MHNITISVFIEQEEDEKVIAEHISKLLPENFVDEKITMEIERVKIQDGRDIYILKVTVEKERHTKFILAQIKEFLGEEQCKRIAQEENRVDAKGKLFMRLDKIDFIEHDTATLVDHGKCIHVSMLVAAYPKNRTRALEIVKDMFS